MINKKSKEEINREHKEWRIKKPDTKFRLIYLLT